MEIGDQVPDTSVPNQDGQPVSLNDFRGKPVVLFFFPKADTPG
jgi:peroxiredoxin Q/BCP